MSATAEKTEPMVVASTRIRRELAVRARRAGITPSELYRDALERFAANAAGHEGCSA